MQESKRQKVNEKPSLSFISKFSELLGHFDLLPKIGYKDLESFVGDAPCFMCWGIYLVEAKESAIKMPFSIVENLDNTGEVFLIKDTRILTPVIVNRGVCPSTWSVAELREGKWYHAGLSEDRIRFWDTHKELMAFCTKTALVVNLLPLQTLAIECEHRADNDDAVYFAISREREKRDKRLKKKKKEEEKEPKPEPERKRKKKKAV